MQIWRRTALAVSCLTLLCAVLLVRVHLIQAKEAEATGPGLTIYNQQFAVVRQTMPLALKAGTNHVEVTDITGHLEPDSVILRSLDQARQIKILEQNYRNDPVTQQLLLSLYEGKTIDFEIVTPDGKRQVTQGKIIRSGFVPHSASAYSMYAQNDYQAQATYAQNGADQPVIEVNGKLQFTLPGLPIFPALADDTVLKPTLSWELAADKGGATPAELSYVTGGMNWNASYNVVAPPKGNELEMVGWVTLDNQSGKTFPDARIKLMAGDVNKVQPQQGGVISGMASMGKLQVGFGQPAVTEKAFDEYHLYTLANPTTLHDRETKQVEFVRAAGIQSKTVYVYDGFKIDQNFAGWNMETIRQQESYGTLSNPKVWVIQEFKNSSENHLGMPLPKGRVRFYRRDDDGQLEFTGEDEIDHTPKDETIRTYTGSAFDITGERHRQNYKFDQGAQFVDESFELKVRNHKTAPIEVRIVEHLYRWLTWDIAKNSDPFTKLDSQTIAFTVKIPPDGEKTVTYQVHYSW
jgi:hypothetical protein